jgi:hypothetical protein
VESGERRGRGARPKTYARYLTAAFLAGGGQLSQSVNLEDLRNAVGMMVVMGRVPHPTKWVESAIVEAEADAVEGLF